MININLLPEKMQRRKSRKGLLPGGLVLPREIVIGLIGGFLVFLAVWHVLLQVVIMGRCIQLRAMESRWKKVMPQKMEVDAVVKELRGLQSRLKAIKSLKGPNEISWSRKLKTLSDDVSYGVWLRQLALEDNTLLINGSSASKHKVEMINVHNFVKALKNDAVFMAGVASMELESIKSRQVGEASVADFVVRVVLETGKKE